MELLDHPHVIRVFETYEDEENIYIVLEYIFCFKPIF